MPLAEGVPAYRVTTTCTQTRYRIEKQILTDPDRPVVFQWTQFVPLNGPLAKYHVYVLLAPHLANHGMGNTAWVGDYKGIPMLFAERDGCALVHAAINSPEVSHERNASSTGARGANCFRSLATV